MSKPDITTDSDLHALCEILASQDSVALDTEFLREKTFYPVLALVQIAYPGSDPILLDPLTITDWGPFHAILKDKKILKIMHAGRQDLEIFAFQMGEIPEPVFDTQIAASMCGLGDQLGYAALVQKICKEHLQKSDGYTDWLQRPLTERQAAYARNDVRYLIEIHQKLNEMSQVMGRTRWVDEEIQETYPKDLFDANPDDAWMRVKKWSSLVDRDLIVLQALARWRELRARELDKPVRFVVSDEGLIGICRMKQVNLEDIRARRSLTRLPLTEIASRIMEVHQQARLIPSDSWPRFRNKKRSPSEDSELIAELSWALLHMVARDSKISASRLVSKKELPLLIDRLLAGNDVSDHTLFHGWRLEMAGHLIIKMVSGKLGLTVDEGKVAMVQAGDAS